uniref:(California timema) hypothetical protein n=1 Tax=Timema californicum TaxID=61474 RepID=A0A7R9P674_TIMCA|nr:unnamed protein product [Timema californicum]
MTPLLPEKGRLENVKKRAGTTATCVTERHHKPKVKELTWAFKVAMRKAILVMKEVTRYVGNRLWNEQRQKLGLPEGTGAVDQARKSGPRGHRNRDCGLPGQSVMFKYMSFALKGIKPILVGYTKVQLIRKVHAVTGQNQTINDSRCFLIRTIQLNSAARHAASLLLPGNKTLFMYKEFGVN